MAVCLSTQSVYYRRAELHLPFKIHLAAALFLFASLCGRIWIKVEATDVGYGIARERQKTVRLDMELRELELQRSVLLRPDILSRRALRELKLEALLPSQATKVIY